MVSSNIENALSCPRISLSPLYLMQCFELLLSSSMHSDFLLYRCYAARSTIVLFLSVLYQHCFLFTSTFCSPVPVSQAYISWLFQPSLCHFECTLSFEGDRPTSSSSSIWLGLPWYIVFLAPLGLQRHLFGARSSSLCISVQVLHLSFTVKHITLHFQHGHVLSFVLATSST